MNCFCSSSSSVSDEDILRSDKWIFDSFLRLVTFRWCLTNLFMKKFCWFCLLLRNDLSSSSCPEYGRGTTGVFLFTQIAFLWEVSLESLEWSKILISNFLPNIWSFLAEKVPKFKSLLFWRLLRLELNFKMK